MNRLADMNDYIWAALIIVAAAFIIIVVLG